MRDKEHSYIHAEDIDCNSFYQLSCRAGSVKTIYTIRGKRYISSFSLTKRTEKRDLRDDFVFPDAVFDCVVRHVFILC